MSRSLTSTLATLVAATAFATACANLTAPPSPEPVASEAVAAAAAPPASSNAGGGAGGVKSAAPAPAPAPPPPSGEKVTIQELTPGKGGPPAKSGDTVSVLYKGFFTDGKEFDGSERHGNEPMSFPLGPGPSPIRGFQDGILGMKAGQKRKVTIPASLAYGAKGSPPIIPPNSILVFEIEVTNLKPGSP